VCKEACSWGDGAAGGALGDEADDLELYR